MMTYLLYDSNPWLLPAVMLVVLVAAIGVPVAFGKRLGPKAPASDDGWGVIQGGILTLVAFMLGISFSQSQARFDTRRQLVVTEANAIGTTWLRADQLSAADSRRFRAILTDYTANRLQAYQGPMSPEMLDRVQAKSDGLQTQLWAIAATALRASPQNLGRSLLMETLNDTIDQSAEELAALTHHVPTVIVTLTLLLVVLGALIIGLGLARSGSQPRALAGVYVVASVLVITMMVDLDRPQRGFVHVNLDPMTIQLKAMQQ